MNEYRTDRISRDVQKELVEVLSKIKDPRVTNSLLSILRVEVTRDLSFANVYITSLDGIEGAKEGVEGLNSAKGFMKRELAKRLNLRKMPELIFIPNDSIAYSNEIFTKLKELEGE